MLLSLPPVSSHKLVSFGFVVVVFLLLNQLSMLVREGWDGNVPGWLGRGLSPVISHLVWLLQTASAAT